MYRGRPHRGEYPRSYGPPPGAHSRASHHSHSPPGSGRHMPSGPYRDDRERHGYHHGYPDDYRRSPPRRRYPSPGSSSYRGPSGEYRGNGPPPREHLSKRLTPSPSRGDIPVDHSLVITVGNELTGSQPPRSSRNSEHHYERDYHNRHPPDMRPGYERRSEERCRRRSPSQGRSRPRSRSRSRGRGRSRSRSRGKSRGRSKSRVRSRSRSRGRSASRSRGKSRGRSKSRARSRSRSRSRSRGRSRAREKSRSRSGSSSSSSSSSRSPSPKSKSKDEFRELELARRRKELEEMLGAPTKSILKKRVDSETDSPVALQSGDSPALGSAEPQSSNLSRETERFLSAVSKGMEAGLFASMLGDMVEQPHDQQTQAPGHGLNLSQYEEILSMVKRRGDGDRIGELLLPHEQVRQDSSGFSRILGLMGNLPDPQEKRKSFADIEDEEKFLYGDGDENEGDKEKVIAQSPTVTPTRGTQLHSQPELSPYGESRPEIAKYHDNKFGMAQYYDTKPEVPEYSGGQQFVQRSLSETHEPLREAYAGTVDSTYRHSSVAPEDRLDAGVPRSSHQQVQPEVRYRRHSQPVATTSQNNNSHVAMPQKQSEPDEYLPGLDPREAKERQEVAEYERIQDLLKTIGLDLGVAEISKMAARTQERLHGKKPPTAASRRRQERRTSSGNYDRRKSHSSTSSSGSSQSRSRSRSRGRSRGRSRKRTPDTERRSVSPRPTRLVSLGESLADSGKSDLEVKVEDKSWGIPVLGKGAPQPRITVTMNPPPNLSSMPQSMPAMGPHTIQAMAGYQGQTPGYPLPPPNYPPPGYGQFEGYMPYMPPGWPMYPPPSMLPPQSPVEDVPVSSASSRPYLRVIETVPTETKDSRSSQTAGKSEASASKPDPEDRFTSQDAKEEIGQSQRLSEEKNKASQRDKVIEEKEKLKKERDVRMKKKEYLMKELERLRKQQGELLRKKRRERDGHKDPLLAELGRLQEEVMVQISKLRKEHVEAEQKRVELDKVLLILGKEGSDKHRRECRPSGDRGEPPSSERTSSKPPATSSSASVPSAKVASAFETIPEKLKPKSQQDAAPPEKSPDLYEYYDSGNHWCKNCNTVCGSMFDFFTHLQSKTHRKTLDPYDRPWASNASTKEKKRTHGEKIVRPAKGCEFVIPVRGFFCQLCEEFFGDQICAEEHVTCHSHNEKYKKRMDEHPMYEQRRNLDRQAGLSVATDSRDRKHSELKRKLEVEVPATRECKSASPGEEPPPKHKERRSQDSREEKSASFKEETSSSRREEKAQRRQEGRPYSEKEEKRASAKEEKEVRKKTPVREVKAEPQKPEEVPEKPPPKVICGPSPSILAKVRRRNEEAVKNASSTSAFGKFSWKKSEKDKEKEEEKEMANILAEEEDEDDGEGQDDPKGTFAKAKAIAIKLSGKTVIPPSNPWLPLSSAQSAPAKIRPTLLAPKMVLRKSTPSATSKPAPLNTFLSIKPTSSSNGKPLPVVKPPAKKETVLTPDLISKAFGGQEVVLKTPEVPVKPTPAPEKIQSPSTDVKKPPAQTKAVAQPLEPPPPGMNLMSFESDVAAPGVPAGEISMPVLVCPPPLHMTEGPRKSDKPKSNLAAAKAQDLYDIFYSGGAKSASDRLAGAKQPKGGEGPKSKDSTAPKTEDKSETGDAQKDCGDGKDCEISEAEKDASYSQLDMGDIFAYNFE